MVAPHCGNNIALNCGKNTRGEKEMVMWEFWLQWAGTNGCPWSTTATCTEAAEGGHMEVLQWACTSSIFSLLAGAVHSGARRVCIVFDKNKKRSTKQYLSPGRECYEFSLVDVVGVRVLEFLPGDFYSVDCWTGLLMKLQLSSIPTCPFSWHWS
jgi:hypothetical protein